MLLILDASDFPISGGLDGGGVLDGSPGIFKLFHSLEVMRNSLQNINVIILHNVKTIGKIIDALFLNLKRNTIISIRIAMAV
nr:hypothetical protein [uncultured Blautia sp.]